MSNLKEEKEEVITLAMKEEEIRNAYKNITMKNKKTIKEEKPKKKKSIKEIIFLIMILLLIMISMDIICVARYDKGPFLAIPIKRHKDGSKEYYGLGYKVIKYNEKIGRTSRKLGLWNLKYNKPLYVKTKDITKDLSKDNLQSYKGKYVKIESTLYEIDPENQSIIAKTKDEDNDIVLQIICPIAEDRSVLNKLKANEKIGLVGYIKKIEKKERNIEFYIKECLTNQ